MNKGPRILWLTGMLLVILGIWPILHVVNRIYPVILGLPLFVFYMLALNLAVAGFLLIAFWMLD
jgi:hypothetical protein